MIIIHRTSDGIITFSKSVKSHLKHANCKIFFCPNSKMLILPLSCFLENAGFEAKAGKVTFVCSHLKWQAHPRIAGICLNLVHTYSSYTNTCD